jgi:hypothetical protein
VRTKPGTAIQTTPLSFFVCTIRVKLRPLQISGTRTLRHSLPSTDRKIFVRIIALLSISIKAGKTEKEVSEGRKILLVVMLQYLTPFICLVPGFNRTFLNKCGVVLPNHNQQRIVGFDIRPGSDHDSSSDDEESWIEETVYTEELVEDTDIVDHGPEVATPDCRIDEVIKDFRAKSGFLRKSEDSSDAMIKVTFLDRRNALPVRGGGRNQSYCAALVPLLSGVDTDHVMGSFCAKTRILKVEIPIDSMMHTMNAKNVLGEFNNGDSGLVDALQAVTDKEYDTVDKADGAKAFQQKICLPDSLPALEEGIRCPFTLEKVPKVQNAVMIFAAQAAVGTTQTEALYAVFFFKTKEDEINLPGYAAVGRKVWGRSPQTKPSPVATAAANYAAPLSGQKKNSPKRARVNESQNMFNGSPNSQSTGSDVSFNTANNDG